MADAELPLCNGENNSGATRHFITWVQENGNGYMGCLECRKPMENIKPPDVKVDTTQNFVGL